MVLTILDGLGNIYDKKKITNLRIFNTDEASLTVVQRSEIITQNANIRLEPRDPAKKSRM